MKEYSALHSGSKWQLMGWKAGLKYVVFKPITVANTRVAEMFSSGIDMMVEVPPDNVATFSSNSSCALHEKAGPHIWFLILNLKQGPLQDKPVRQALKYAINNQALVKNVLQNIATVASEPTPAAFSWTYNDALRPNFSIQLKHASW